MYLLRYYNPQRGYVYMEFESDEQAMVKLSRLQNLHGYDDVRVFERIY